jgi:hypothetical protein
MRQSTKRRDANRFHLLTEVLLMENKKKSRREVLKLIGKTGLFLGAVPVFFTSLKITSQSEAATNYLTGATQLTNIQEKAFISGSGSSLTVNVTGKPGRAFFVTFAATDIKENYRRISGSDGIINARGTGTLTVNVRYIPNTRIYLKVITAEPTNLRTPVGGTEPFVVSIRNGAIYSFEGLVSRPILGGATESAQVLIAMAATTQNNTFQLR